jgi:CBS domain containing-hemolysin-like protein
METVTFVFIVLACVVLSAFFSGSETALLRLNEHELDRDVKEARGPGALAVRELLRSTSRLLVTILLGNNVVNILGAAVASAMLVRQLGEQNGIIVSTVVMTLTVFIFGEVLPKVAAARHPRRIAYAVALPLYLLHQLLRPLHVLYDLTIERLVKRMGSEAETMPMTAAEEVMRLARRSVQKHPKGSPLAIIGATAEASERTVGEIMVPRTEIVAFPVTMDPKALLEQVLEEGYTRLPIYEDSIDKVLGVVHLKDLVKLIGARGGDLRGTLKPVLQVPERKPILQQLTDMQRAFVHVAIVKDEFGVTQGMVTQEDILEELVGEIRDEHDRDELLTIRRIGEHSYLSRGRVKVLDFNRETGWKVLAEPGDTLAGLVFNTLARHPRPGESVLVPGYEISVVDTSGSRITQVRVTEIGETDRGAEPSSSEG